MVYMDRERGLDLFIAQYDVLAVFLLDAFDDILDLNFLAGALVDALVADWIPGTFVEPVEVDAEFL